MPVLTTRRILLLGAALLGFGAVPAQAQPSVAEQLVDGLEGVFGRHAGMRRGGSRGVGAQGEWISTGEGRRMSTAATLQPGVRAPVVARFSIGGGNPNAPENAASVRGLSFSVAGPRDEPHEFVLINTPVFTARTPESFVNFLRIRAPNPATRPMSAPAVAAANAANPDWMPQMGYLRDLPPLASYATERHFGVNSFVFKDAAGMSRHARWTFEPVAGRVGLTPEERQARGPNFLPGELRQRVASGAAEWRVLLELPAGADPLDDATAAWPADRPTIEVARLRITAVQPDGLRSACDAQVFNPMLLPEGIEPSADPILNARAEAYAVSLSRRAQ